MKLPAAYKGSEPYIFVSYSHVDREEVLKDIIWMVGLGYRVWYDEGIEFGQDFPTELAIAIKNCSQFIIYISPNSVISKYVNREFDYANFLGFKVFPVYLEHTELPERLEFLMSTTHRLYRFRYPWQDFCEYYEKGIYEQCRYIPDATKEKPKSSESGKPLKSAKTLDSSLPESTEQACKTEPDESAYRILQFFDEHSHSAKLTEYIRGSRISRYEVQFEKATKLESIKKLAKDLARALDVPSVLIDGSMERNNSVFIEAPNKIEFFTPVQTILKTAEFRDAPSLLTVALGNDISGKHYLVDLSKLPHVLIAGVTGSGKTALIESMIVSLLYKTTPDELKLLLIDLKNTELSRFDGLPNLLFPVVHGLRHAGNSLTWLTEEMVRRYLLFHDFNVRGLDGYLALQSAGKEVLPRIVVFIDEFSDLMLERADKTEEAIMRIAQMGKAVGIHLILATQRPSISVITGIIKANIPTRIAFMVNTVVDSRIILDQSGAENLLGKGDLLYFPISASRPVRLQGCSASERDIDEARRFVLSRFGEEPVVYTLPDEITNAPQPKPEDAHDPKLIEAARIAALQGNITITDVQRNLHIGYAHASRLIDMLETLGIISPLESSKPRELLVTPGQIEHLLEMHDAGQ